VKGSSSPNGSNAYRQAVVLVGGEGSRLRPITSRVPKPAAPLLGRPFISYILENLVRHGVDRVVFSTGYLAAAIEAEVGDGGRYGLEVRYAFEDSPLGTAGAIKNAASELRPGGFLVLNGDILSDADLSAIVAFHRERQAVATLLTTAVDDPSRYGLVDVRADGRVASFVEKPGDEWTGPGLINAGVYVLEHEALDLVPPGREFSIERGVFPSLAASESLYAYVGTGYWLDIGTPQSYLQAHFDLLRSPFEILTGRGLDDGDDGNGQDLISISPTARIDPEARVVPPVHVAGEAVIKRGATVGPLTVVGRGARVGRGAHVVASVLQDGVKIGRDAVVDHSVIVRRATIGSGSWLSDVVIGEACDVGKGNILANGLHLFPQAILPDRSVKFRDPGAPAPTVATGTLDTAEQDELSVAALEDLAAAPRDLERGDLEPAA
jgi:mannose-1-phosphate guanylyltransferase